jgi:hypothetical protein
MSSTGELDPSILLTRERKTLSARECVRTVDGDDVEEYDEDEDKLESGEFNSHILQMSFSPNIWSSPPCGRKHSSSSPRGSPISIRRVLQGQKAIIWQIRGGYWWHQGWHFSRSSISPSRNGKAKE